MCFFERVWGEVLSADESRELDSCLSWADKIVQHGKEIILKNETSGKTSERDADRIIALALIRHLYNEGKISELVYKNIKKETIGKISVANREILW